VAGEKKRLCWSGRHHQIKGKEKKTQLHVKMGRPGILGTLKKEEREEKTALNPLRRPR